MKQTKVIFKPENFGKGLGLLWKLGWGWKFYIEDHNSKKKIDDIDEEENTNFITVSDSIVPNLYAVTEKQFKSWKKQKVLYEFRWGMSWLKKCKLLSWFFRTKN